MKINKLSQDEATSELLPSKYLFLSLPYAVVVFMFSTFPILQGVYTKYFGLSLTAVAGVIFFSRILDGVTDPLIGYWSDRYYAKNGTRKPFVVVGGILFVLGGFFLYMPPENISIIYFYSWFTVFIVGYTLFLIPHTAWASELASDTNEKTKIFSILTMSAYVGSILFFCLPLLPFFETTEITPETLRWCAIAAAILMVPALLLCITRVPNGHSAPQVSQANNGTSSNENVFHQLSLIIHNRPFVIYIGLYLCIGMGLGLWYGLIFIYVDTYLAMGDQFAKMYLIAYIVGITFAPIWYKFSTIFGKRVSLCIAVGLSLVAIVYTVSLTPGSTSFIELVMIKIINTLSLGAIFILGQSVLSDIIDYGTWKFKTNQAATYFSVNMFLSKSVGGIGMALALAIIGWYGFDMTATTQTEAGVSGLRLAIAWLPCAFLLMALVFATRLPITARRHDIIRRRLDARETTAKQVALTRQSAVERSESNLKNHSGSCV